MSEISKSGVYIISNTETGDCYIGSSINMQKRMNQHRRMLRLKSHHSALLQEAWNLYGEECFTFDVLEIAPLNDLVEVEQRYIDTRKPRYNPARIALRNGAGLTPSPEELQRRQDDARQARLVIMSHYDELARLRAMAERDDDVMKAISVAGTFSSDEIRMIVESSDLAEILYQEGIVSGKQLLKLLPLLNEERVFDWQLLITTWVERGVREAEIPSLLKTLGMSGNTSDLPPAMTATELALNALASTVSRELHVTHDSQGFVEIQHDVQTAGEIVGHTREEIERATGRAVVSPRNMIKEPDGGLWGLVGSGDDES